MPFLFVICFSIVLTLGAVCFGLLDIAKAIREHTEVLRGGTDDDDEGWVPVDYDNVVWLHDTSRGYPEDRDAD